MKRVFSLMFLSAAFMFSMGCQQTPPPSNPAPAPKASAPAAPSPSASASTEASPGASGGPSGSPGANASGAPGAVKMSETTHPESGLSWDMPDDWKKDAKSKDVLVLSTPDGGTALIFSVIPTEKVKEYSDNLDKELGKSLTKMKEDPSTKKEEDVNGIHQVMESGSAELQGKPTEWTVWFAVGKEGKTVVMFGFGNLKSNAPTLDAIRKSIKQGKATAASSDETKKGGEEAKKGGDDTKKGGEEAKKGGDDAKKGGDDSSDDKE